MRGFESTETKMLTPLTDDCGPYTACHVNDEADS